MRINKDDKIAGLPTLEIRELLRKLKGDKFHSDHVAYYLKASIDEASILIGKLEKENLIEKAYFAFNKQHWTVTLKGSALALASAASPIHRKTAEKNLKKFLERVKQVNDDNYYLYKVTKVLVFGSYLSNKEKINDLDIAVEMKSKIPDKNERMQIERNRVNEVYESGKIFSNFTEQLFYPRKEVLKYLKSGSRSISLHTTDDEIIERCEYRILFEDD